MRSIRIRKQFLKKRYLHIFLVEVLSQQNFKGSQLPGQSWDRYWINAGPILSLGTTIRPKEKFSSNFLRVSLGGVFLLVLGYFCMWWRHWWRHARNFWMRGKKLQKYFINTFRGYSPKSRCLAVTIKYVHPTIKYPPPLYTDEGLSVYIFALINFPDNLFPRIGRH